MKVKETTRGENDVGGFEHILLYTTTAEAGISHVGGNLSVFLLRLNLGQSDTQRMFMPSE